MLFEHKIKPLFLFHYDIHNMDKPSNSDIKLSFKDTAFVKELFNGDSNNGRYELSQIEVENQTPYI